MFLNIFRPAIYITLLSCSLTLNASTDSLIEISSAATAADASTHTTTNNQTRTSEQTSSNSASINKLTDTSTAVDTVVTQFSPAAASTSSSTSTPAAAPTATFTSTSASTYSFSHSPDSYSSENNAPVVRHKTTPTSARRPADVASTSNDLSIIDVRRNIPLSDTDPVYKDYYINAGVESGLKENLVITVLRKTNIKDASGTQSYGDILIPVGRLKIIAAYHRVAVAREFQLISRESQPMLEQVGLMNGDRVDLAGSFIDNKKASDK